jgi:DNA (cytosine-5)-methyltransferase 1
MGYHRAGFEVVGVDYRPQPCYPFEFVQADAIDYPLGGFHAVHASPPCQAYSNVSNRWGVGPENRDHPDLVEVVRYKLRESGLPYVIENVPGAPIENPLRLHGGMFGLSIARPRLFESNLYLMRPFAAVPKGGLGIYGELDGRRLSKHGQRAPKTLLEAQEAMDMPWADWAGIRLAIPPAYTEHIGRQLMAHLRWLAA